MSHIRVAFPRVLFLSILLTAVISCDKGTETPKQPPQDPGWSEYISQHTSGVIKKRSEIRLRFVNDIVEEAQIGQDASKVLNFEPAVKAETTYNGRREILVKPLEDMQSGKRYQVKVLGRQVSGIPDNLDVYEFYFDVVPRDFEVNLLGLRTTATTASLSGSVLTSDQENSEAIEKLLSFDLPDQALSVNWYHNEDGTSHEFRIENIQRVAEQTKLTISWNGEALGLDNRSGQQELDVPALGEFKIAKVQGVKDDNQYIQVQFSDRLDPKQNIKGLIGLSEGAFTVRVEGDLVKIYPSKQAEGKYTVALEQGIRSESGATLAQRVEHEVFFQMQKPQVRFAGTGVVLPENDVLSIPFEALNVKSVQVTAFRVYENNIGQFLQTNKLDGSDQLGRVGRHLWRKTVELGDINSNTWNRFSLDATELMKEHPGGLFRLTLSINRGNAITACSAADDSVPVEEEGALSDNEDLYVVESSGWDFAEDYYGYGGYSWQDRDNPCKDSYYKYGNTTKVSRNFIASNIGLIAKRGSTGKLHVVATRLSDAKPFSGVEVSAFNFQNQLIGSGVADASGFVAINTDGTPFYLMAKQGKQHGYLKINAATALPISHFDVGGEAVKQGVKGYIYGERGVWRPGDNIYLTFVLEDKNDVIPAKHPVTMQLFNPQGQLLQSVVNNDPVDDFYVFDLKTADDAPTGNWTAKALLGGSTFTKALKIETVMPNRLKVELNFDADELREQAMPANGHVISQWLHGATAANLKTDVEVRLVPRATNFTRNADFIFDDPARSFQTESQTVFEGNLDESGRVDFSAYISSNAEAPGMLTANFTTRVFEQGGAFSVSQSSKPYHPYDHYVGIKLPKGDATRNMLLTDNKHPVEISTLDYQGEPVSVERVQVSIYKVEWKWWWDKSGESLANYARGSHSNLLKQDTIATVDGRGQWEFEIKYPDWGRYLIRACDLDGKHCSGQLVYIDWPGWAGRAQESGGVGANALTLTSDKTQYKVGESALINLPPATQGRALISVESGSAVIQQEWFEFSESKSQFSLPLTEAMSPNVYVNVTLLQPHQNKQNDRPIRLYGVIPIKVENPATRLQPVLNAADEWAPASTVEIEVSEQQGREMTYTVAVVDEGLLGLTSFSTPKLHDHFYKKEALGVMSWDLYDYVAGAYGGELERLLALGGGDEGEQQKQQQEEKRFPPVVRFIGPFKLKAKTSNRHQIDLPQYIGAVRVMVVAGGRGAYGSSDKSVLVRGALSLLATMPRVVRPQEELTVPVSLFAMKEGVSKAELSIDTNQYFEIIGDAKQTVSFDAIGEKLLTFKLKVKSELGKGHLKFSARSGEHSAESEIFIDVNAANPSTIRQTTVTLESKDEWQGVIKPHGLPGTNKVTLEVSAIPPINLERRLSYLIRYPHGCVEQTTSAVFPQLYLPTLLRLEPAAKQRVQDNINIGIDRLRMFQVGNGAFVYWPGGWGSYVNEWATSYVGHFLVEADKLGYHVPQEVLDNWINYQTGTAQAWLTGSGESRMNQAYRLYTLALAGKPELAAMNRLREAGGLTSVEKWQLAAAYRLAGLSSAAEDVVRGDNLHVDEYAISGTTYGSALRDKAIILNGLVLLGENKKAAKLAEEISAELYADKWFSTQSVAYSLLAMSKYVGSDQLENFLSFGYGVGKGELQQEQMDTPLFSQELTGFGDEPQQLTLKSQAKRDLYISVFSEGVSKAGEEQAVSKGLRISVAYTNTSGFPLEIGSLAQGKDFVANVTVRNLTDVKLENIALTQMVASGWEIHNPRFAGERDSAVPVDYQDIRDDRVLTYFPLNGLEEKSFKVLLNASYLGKYYLPGISVEAMYDANYHASTIGQWVSVIK